jgi:hypothetical protein
VKTLIVQKKIQCLEEKIAIFKEQKNWSGLAFKYYADTVKRTPKWNSKIRFRMVVSFNATTKKHKQGNCTAFVDFCSIDY